MAGKPKLHYFDARGRMEAIRWLLAAAGAEFEEKLIESSEDLDKLRYDGSLVFQQVPMVEIDGMKLVQTRAILNYIATKYDLYGKDMKERALIDMYTEGVADLGEMIMLLPLCPPDQKNTKLTLIRERATNCYLPAFENVLKSHRQDYLVGNKLSKADIHLVELLYYVEELDPSLLANFPLLKEIQFQSLGQEDPLEDGMATHSNIFALKTPGTEEPGRVKSMAEVHVNLHDRSSLGSPQ
uniref:Glutathione S-transferase n=1 Tax=Bos taurus TaxID=9913 RepID=E1BGC0_BOVIN